MRREELVAAAGESIRRGSKSFHMSSRLFDRRTRERAWLLYCWCRHCDDLCDGQSLGHGSSGGQGAAEAEALTRLALAGEATGRLPFDALGALLAECPVPKRYIEDHLAGFALDDAGWRPQNEDDLIRYCYHVAGAVGCMMAVVMGVDPADEETLRRASDLGIAFQLSNIARDVRDDHQWGRCYLPQDWLGALSLREEILLEAKARDRLVALVRRLTDLAARYEESARLGFPKLPFRARWAVAAATRIYGTIGRRVAALGPSAWDRRVVIPRRKKVSMLFPSLLDTVRSGRGG